MEKQKSLHSLLSWNVLNYSNFTIKSKIQIIYKYCIIIIYKYSSRFKSIKANIRFQKKKSHYHY